MHLDVYNSWGIEIAYQYDLNGLSLRGDNVLISYAGKYQKEFAGDNPGKQQFIKNLKFRANASKIVHLNVLRKWQKLCPLHSALIEFNPNPVYTATYRYPKDATSKLYRSVTCSNQNFSTRLNSKVPKKQGYFVRWTMKQTEPCTLVKTARYYWAYTIFYDGVDNTILASKYVASPNNIKYPKAPKHPGMTFVEWRKSSRTEDGTMAITAIYKKQ